MEDQELLDAIQRKFRHLTLSGLVARIEKAPDFGYDDESTELNRRLASKGMDWRWKGDRIEMFETGGT